MKNRPLEYLDLADSVSESTYKLIIRHINKEPMTLELFASLEESLLTNIPGVGRKKISKLLSAQDKIKNILNGEILLGNSIEHKDNALITVDVSQTEPGKPKFCSIAEDIKLTLDAADSAFVNYFLSKVNSIQENKRKVLNAHFNFDKNARTLKDVGKELGVTESRVSQMQKNILKGIKIDIINNLYREADLIYNSIDKMDICTELPKLNSCTHHNVKYFYRLIEFICDLPNNYLYLKHQTQEQLNSNFFNTLQSLFRKSLGSVSKASLTISLQIEHNMTEDNASRIILDWELSNLIRSIGDDYYLVAANSRQDAITHLLSFHPKGLSTRDIHKKAQYFLNLSDKEDVGYIYQKYLKKNIGIYRDSHHHYRHVSYIELREDNYKAIENMIIDSLRSNPGSKELKTVLTELDLLKYYFEVLHYIKSSNYLFRFGSGHCEYVALEKSIKVENLSAEIVSALQTINGMSKNDLCKIISKSEERISSTISQLIAAKKILKIDSEKYIEKETFKSTVEYIEAAPVILYLLNNTNQIIEADYFRETLMVKFNINRSKHFCVSIIKCLSEIKPIYYNNNICSLSPLKYLGIYEAYFQFFKECKSHSASLTKLRSTILTTDSYIALMKNTWRSRAEQEVKRLPDVTP